MGAHFFIRISIVQHMCTFTVLILLLIFFQTMHYYAVNFVFNVSFRRGSKRKKNIQKKKGHFERSSLFLFQTFSRNDLPGEAALSRGRSVFKKRKKRKKKKKKLSPLPPKKKKKKKKKS